MFIHTIKAGRRVKGQGLDLHSHPHTKSIRKSEGARSRVKYPPQHVIKVWLRVKLVWSLNTNLMHENTQHSADKFATNIEGDRVTVTAHTRRETIYSFLGLLTWTYQGQHASTMISGRTINFTLPKVHYKRLFKPMINLLNIG